MTKLLPSFPQRVYNVLKFCEEQGREDIISWEKDGTAFTVNDLQQFERDILPRCFNTTKYSSFTRTLHGYGFTCVRTGRQPGIYSHPNFNRDDPISPSLMRRVYGKKNANEGTIPDHDIPNPSIEALNNRSLSPRPSVLNDAEQGCQQSPSDETGCTSDDGDTATVFGRSYHTIAPQVVDRSTSLPVQFPKGSPELPTSSMFDSGEIDIIRMDTRRPYPNPISSTFASHNTTSNTAVKDHRRRKPSYT